jgi:hypothetical protein
MAQLALHMLQTQENTWGYPIFRENRWTGLMTEILPRVLICYITLVLRPT